MAKATGRAQSGAHGRGWREIPGRARCRPYRVERAGCVPCTRRRRIRVRGPAGSRVWTSTPMPASRGDRDPSPFIRLPPLSSPRHDDVVLTVRRRSIPLDRLASRDRGDDRLGVHVLRLPGPAAGLGAGSRLVEDRTLVRLHDLARGVGIAHSDHRAPHRPRSRPRNLRRRRLHWARCSWVCSAPSPSCGSSTASGSDSALQCRAPLYEACFALLVRSTGDQARRAITIVSIVAGICGHRGVPRCAPVDRSVRLARRGPGVRSGGPAASRCPSSGEHAATPKLGPRRRHRHRLRARPRPGAGGRANRCLLAVLGSDISRRARPRHAHLPRPPNPGRSRRRSRRGGDRGVVRRSHAGRRSPGADGGGPVRDHPWPRLLPASQ